MTSSGQTICLSMIVKDEAHVIRRCLDSVRPVIDYWVIVDTGSTDGTQDIIRAALAGTPGQLMERPWVDFAHNRSEALELARPHGSYSLIIDADDELIIPAGFTMPKLDAPGYTFTIHDSFTRYSRRQMVSNAMTWYYRGVLHEFLESKQISWTRPFPLAMRRGDDGARHRDRTTYRRDVEVLEKALAKENDPFLISRYTFYLAQSYRDCGDKEQALKYYLRRADQGFWEEEVYISLLGAAYLSDAVNAPADEVLSIYDRAIAICPDRAEARHGATRYCREKHRTVEGFHYAAAALSIKMPPNSLFTQPWIYLYGMRDEYAVCAYFTGQYRACLSACLEILDQKEVPPDIRSRIVRLSREALEKMVDPVWGFHKSSYSSEYIPHWQVKGHHQSPTEPPFETHGSGVS